MALNSRSGSETRRLDPDDDRLDSRSSSGSAGKGSMSRDITPNTHYSNNGSNPILPELSERERKKLAKEEEMFRRQEEEAVGKQIKKKRTSGGGLGVKPASRYTEVNGKRSGKRTKSTTVKMVDERRTKPVYAEASTQCDLDAEEAIAKAEARQRAHAQRRQHLPFHHGILQRCVVANAMWRRNAGHTKPLSKAVSDGDVAMADGDFAATSAKAKSKLDGITQQSEDHAGINLPHPLEPPVPPWTDKKTTDIDPVDQSSSPNESGEMKIEMPPPVTNPFAHPTTLLSATTPTGASATAITQSPAGATSASLLSPSIQSVMTPARKKLSLSDYTRRSKAKETDPKTERDSSPSSIASGPVATQPEQKSAKDAMVADDVQMDEHAINGSSDVQSVAGA